MIYEVIATLCLDEVRLYKQQRSHLIMGMFSKIEIEARKELLTLFREFVLNPKSRRIKQKAEWLSQKYNVADGLLIKEVSYAS